MFYVPIFCKPNFLFEIISFDEIFGNIIYLLVRKKWLNSNLLTYKMKKILFVALVAMLGLQPADAQRKGGNTRTPEQMVEKLVRR